MKKKMLALTGLFISSSAFAAAYKIPEQSLRSMATSAAYFASADSADAAYYNPAAMSWIDNGAQTLSELGIRYIYLPRIKFEGLALDPVTSTYTISNAKTLKEEFVVPYLHLIFPASDKFKFGFSFITPYGLSKRWSAEGQRRTAEEFTLKTFEMDLTAAYKVDDRLSLGAGIRGLYSTGEIKYRREPGYRIDMNGESGIEFGYLLSAALKINDKVKVATIYRSQIKPEISGDAKGNLLIPGSPPTLYPIATEGNVKVVLPAEWRLGVSYAPTSSTIFDITYEITFWGEYKKLDINFEDPVAERSLGRPKDKHWHNSKTIRFGIRHKFNEQFTGMAGIAYDETPIPQRTQGFELPDSNGWIFSLGGAWHPNSRTEIGVAYLYVRKFDRHVENTYMKGDFSDMEAHLVNVSLGYKF